MVIVQQSRVMQLMKNMFLLILSCLILTSNSKPTEGKVFDVDFLRSLNSVTNDIKQWVFNDHSDEIIVPALDEDDILLLSSLQDNENNIELITPKRIINEMFLSLECFHSILTLNLFKMIIGDFQQMKKNSLETARITLWEFYVYITRMNAVFSYGNFEVQQWQSKIYSRFKEMQSIYSINEFLRDLQHHDGQDKELIRTMINFANTCQGKNYLPKTNNIFEMIKYSYSLVEFHGWLSCKMDIPCVRVLERSDGDLEAASENNFFAYQKLEKVKEMKKIILNRLTLTRYDMRSLRDPNEFDECKGYWKYRMSASNFGHVCKPFTEEPNQILKRILYYGANVTNAMRYEKLNKKDAIAAFVNKTGLVVTRCGAYVDEELNMFSAQPDGLIGENGILIVKCPENIKNMTPQVAFRRNQIQFLAEDIETGNLVLQGMSNYYYQVQGQLHITKKEHCYFVVWTPLGFFYEIINRKDNVWDFEMEANLINFYHTYLLPELLNPSVVSIYNRYVTGEGEEEEYEEW